MSSSDDDDYGPLLEMTSFHETESDASEEEDEDRVPPLSTCWDRVKYWCGLFRVSLLMLTLNIAAIFVCSFLCYMGYNHMHLSSKTRLSTCICFTLVAASIDAVVALRFARSVEQRMMSHGEEPNELLEQPTTEDKQSFDYISFSKSVDRLFRCTSTNPRHTFLVALMYITATLAALVGGGCVSSLVYVLQAQPKTYFYPYGYNTTVFAPSTCSAWPFYSSRHRSDQNFKKSMSYATLMNASGFDQLPRDIQAWIESKNKSFAVGGYQFPNDDTNSTQSYVETSDGAVAVQIGKLRSTRKSGLLVIGTGSSTSPHVLSNKEVAALVGLPRQPPFSSWCAVLREETRRWNRDESPNETLFPAGMCYSAGEGNVTEFESILLQPKEDDPSDACPSRKRRLAGSRMRVYATNDTLWIATRTDYEQDLEHGFKVEVRFALTGFDASKMERSHSISIAMNGTFAGDTHMYRPGFSLDPSCSTWSKVVFWTGLPLSLVMTALLWRMGVASALVPTSLLLPILFWEKNWPLVLAGLMTLLLTAKNNRCPSSAKTIPIGGLIWSQYALLVAVTAISLVEVAAIFMDGYSFASTLGKMLEQPYTAVLLQPCIAFLISAANALFLGHPIFEFLGLLSVLLSIVSIPYFVHRPLLLCLSLLLIALGLGCAGVGRLCRRYRFHVVVYSRRFWRYLSGFDGKRG